MGNPDLFRAAMEYLGTVTPAQEILGRPAVTEGIRAVTEALRSGPAMQMPGPGRQQLLELVR